MSRAEEKKQIRAFIDIADQINELEAKIVFVYESMPIVSPKNVFSRAGLDGLGYLLDSMRDNIDEARNVLNQANSAE